MVLCTTKETLYTLRKKNPTSELLKKEYTNYTKIINKVNKEAKFKYEKEIFNEIVETLENYRT